MLPKPAPFVFGGSFSEYMKQGSKFSRFETLTTLAQASELDLQDDDEQIDDAADVSSLYAQARAQGIGTVDHIEMPEGSLNIVNLVDIARFMERSWGMAVADDEDAEVWNCEAEEEEEEDEEEEESLTECESKCSTNVSIKELEIPRPVVYSGSFQDWKKEGAKITGFQTLMRFNEASTMTPPAPQAESCPASFKLLSDVVPDILADITSQLELSREPHVFIEGSASLGHMPCQFLALCSPPSMQKEGNMLTSLSDALVQKQLESTMAGAKRALKTAAQKGTGESSEDCDCEEEEEEEEEEVTPSMGHNDIYFPMKQEWSKVNFAHTRSNDDGSNWNIGTSSVKGPLAFVGSRRRSLSQRTSGSSWGAEAGLLEPICQGKLSVDQPYKITIPKLR